MSNSTLGVWRSGPYTSVIGSNNPGLTTDEGYRLRWKNEYVKFKNTNLYGASFLDGIYKGKSDMQLLFTAKEWNSAIKATISTFATTAGTWDGTEIAVGTLLSTKALSIALTAVANTPAATNGPTPITFPFCVPSDQNDWELLLGPDETDMPIIFDLLLYSDGTYNRFFSIG